LTRTYSISEPTASAALVISVQGVVVQATSRSPVWRGDSGTWSVGGTAVTGISTKTDGSSTSWYPCATSCEESAVPQRGQ
jgi:hypothetical protein